MLKRICSLEQAVGSDPREGGIPPPTLSTEWSGRRECTPTSYSPTTFQPEDPFFGLVGVLGGLPAEIVVCFVPFLCPSQQHAG